MRVVPFSPGPPPDSEGKIRWLIERVQQLCTASQVDSPVDVAAENAESFQPLDPDLTTIGGLSKADGNFIVGDGTNWTVESGSTARASMGTIAKAGDTMTGILNLLAASKVLASGGSIGGLFILAKPATGSALAGDVVADISTDTLRIYENGGAFRGLYATLTGAGSQSEIWHEGNRSAIRTSAVIWEIDGGGAAITTGIKGEISVPFACTITAVTLLADQSGSIVVDIYKDTYANYPPTAGDSITASAKPTISAATKSTDSTLTGWTTAIAANDTLKFAVDSVSTITRCTIILTVSRT